MNEFIPILWTFGVTAITFSVLGFYVGNRGLPGVEADLSNVKSDISAIKTDLVGVKAQAAPTTVHVVSTPPVTPVAVVPSV